MTLDLDDLARRESEQVEWKDGVADARKVVRTLVAFSNDFANLGGGYVVCGAKEETDEQGFQRLVRTGLKASRLREIEGRVMSACRSRVEPPISPRVEELPTADSSRRILVFIAPATGHAHQYREKQQDHGVFWIRASRETVEARNGLLRELLVRKGSLERWDRRPVSDADPGALDGLVLREHLTRMRLWESGQHLEDYVSAERSLSPFVPALCARRPLDGPLQPRNFALLLFGREVQRWIPSATAVFSRYSGADRSERFVERHMLDGDIVHQAKKLIEFVNTQATELLDKGDPSSPNLAKYPSRALHEAVINALVHRDYEVERPVRVTVFSDRVEIESPGGLPTGVDPDELMEGRAPPVWRNQALAWFFNRLQLAQAEGQGIPTIFRVMREHGSPTPRFRLSPESVRCVLPAHPRHALMRELREAERLVVQRDLDEALPRLTDILERDPYNSEALILLCEVFQLQGRPERVARLFEDLRLDADRLTSPALVVAGEVLSSAAQPTEAQRELAESLLARAAQGRLDAEEVRRIARGLQRLEQYERAQRVLNDAIERNPRMAHDSALLRLRGDLSIELAKACMDTGRDNSVPRRLRRRAWDHARDHLAEASRVLVVAQEHAWATRREAIDEALAFVRRLQEQAERTPLRRVPRRDPLDDLDALLEVEDDEP